MRKKITKLKQNIFMLLLLFTLPLGAFAAPGIPDVYLCGTGTAKLTPAFGNYTPVNGDVVYWIKDGGTPTPLTISTTGTVEDGSLTVPASLTDGAHTYAVYIQSSVANSCPSAITEFNVYKLPSTTLGLTAVGATFCTTAPTPAVVTAVPADAPPTGVTLDYTWSATKLVSGTVTPVTLTDLGAAVAGIFTFKSGVTPDAYTLTAVAKYNTGAVPIKPAISCEINATAPQLVTVTAAPGKPTITVL